MANAKKMGDIIDRDFYTFFANDVLGYNTMFRPKKQSLIKKVVFNDPATIVYWEDGTKSVVKADNEVFDPEKGLAMAIAKKHLGNEGNYFNEFKKWIPEDYIYRTEETKTVGWVPCSERLPEEDGKYFALMDGFKTPEVRKFINGNWNVKKFTVTHWMPIPDIP